MKLLLLALASSTLLAQPQVVDDAKQAPVPWATLWERVPGGLKTAVAALPPVPGKTPPMEILVRPLNVPSRSADGTANAEAPAEQRSAWAEAPLETYSRTQAKVLAEWMVSPAGGALKFENVAVLSFVSRLGLETRNDEGNVVLVDPNGTKWRLRFKTVGAKPAEKWGTEPVHSDDYQKLLGLASAGDWPGAFDAKLRDSVRKTSPNEPLLVALDILAALDQPAGKEKPLRDAAARLSALRPRSQGALSISAAAYLAAGTPESAGRLAAWIAELKKAAR
jgi:hypothetical protein